jgi:predicted nucleic acid-binding protein
MKLVVADTSPIRYLIRIGEIDLLPKLYPHIILPLTVHHELSSVDAPPEVRQWAKVLPSWVIVQAPARPLHVAQTNLHQGESFAIALALELNATLLLIDDRIGVKVAADLGLTTTGTLGALVEAAQSGMVDIEEVLLKLKQTNFRATPGLFERAIVLALMPPAVPPRRSQT